MEKTDSIMDWAAREVAADRPAKAPKGISEDDIAAKTGLGLTRDEAIRIITNQAEHDARLAKKEKPKAAK